MLNYSAHKCCKIFQSHPALSKFILLKKFENEVSCKIILASSMKDINISSIPLQKLLLEACRNLNIELYIRLPMADDIQHRNDIKRKILELELLIPILSEILKSNSDA